MKKPSKKIVALGIVTVALVGSISIVRFKDNLPFLKNLRFGNNPVSLSVESSEDRAPSIESIDTDEDGLKDWEELLWRTDPNKPDTDQDDTKDGDEVKNGRNPTVPGPNDELSLVDTNAPGIPTGEEKKNLTASDMISRDLFSKFIALKDANGLTQENKDALVAQIASDSKATFSYQAYSRQNLALFNSADKNALKFYASSVAEIQLNLLRDIFNQEQAILSNPSLLTKLYKDAAKSLYDLAVPQALSTEHLAITNNYLIFAEALPVMASLQKDPVRASAALSVYKTATDSQKKNLRTIAEFLRRNDIIFTAEQTGTYWDNF